VKVNKNGLRTRAELQLQAVQACTEGHNFDYFPSSPTAEHSNYRPIFLIISGPGPDFFDFFANRG